MKKNIYQVTAIIKANCTEYKYVVDVDADNQKEAIETAKGMWDKVNHLFHIKARRLEYWEEALYGFWKQYEGEPQTKSKPEEAHVDIDKMTCETKPAPETETNATVKAAIARLTRRVKRETGDNIRDCFEAIAEGHDAASEAIAAMEKEADDYINAVTARFCADGTEVEPETSDEAADVTDTADDNETAAMAEQEITARKMIAEQTTEYLLKTFEGTTTNNDPFIPTVRGWLMDELQSRYPEAFDKWLDSEVCEDAALRGYIEAAERAA